MKVLWPPNRPPAGELAWPKMLPVPKAECDWPGPKPGMLCCPKRPPPPNGLDACCPNMLLPV